MSRNTERIICFANIVFPNNTVRMTENTSIIITEQIKKPRLYYCIYSILSIKNIF